MALSFVGSDLYEPHGEVSTKVWLLLPLRLYVGIVFLVAGFAKVGDRMLSHPDIMIRLFKPVIENPEYPYGFYRAFFHGAIEPNPGLFAFLVVLGEILVGAALVSGTLTRLACGFGIFMVANYFLAFNNHWFPPSNPTTFALIQLVLILVGAGRAYGMDHYLRGKMPKWMA